MCAFSKPSLSLTVYGISIHPFAFWKHHWQDGRSRASMLFEEAASPNWFFRRKNFENYGMGDSLCIFLLSPCLPALQISEMSPFLVGI